MPLPSPDQLSRRERQIMDILHQLGEATAEDVRSRLPDPPSYSAARALLAKLEDKGHVRHREEGLRYVYGPVVSRRVAGRAAAKRLVKVFFEGSVAQAVTGLVEVSADQLTEDQLADLEKAIEEARRRRDEE